MKIENPTKLDIFFKGGGIIKFPVQNLKKVDVEPIEGSDEEIETNSNDYFPSKTKYIGFVFERDITFDFDDENDNVTTKLVENAVLHSFDEINKDFIINNDEAENNYYWQTNIRVIREYNSDDDINSNYIGSFAYSLKLDKDYETSGTDYTIMTNGNANEGSDTLLYDANGNILGIVNIALD